MLWTFLSQRGIWKLRDRPHDNYLIIMLASSIHVKICHFLTLSRTARSHLIPTSGCPESLDSFLRIFELRPVRFKEKLISKNRSVFSPYPYTPLITHLSNLLSHCKESEKRFRVIVTQTWQWRIGLQNLKLGDIYHERNVQCLSLPSLHCVVPMQKLLQLMRCWFVAL